MVNALNFFQSARETGLKNEGFSGVFFSPFSAARQEEATMKRIKLEYEDICTSGKENTEVWEIMINKGNRKYDDQMLLQAVRKGKEMVRTWSFYDGEYFWTKNFFFFMFIFFHLLLLFVGVPRHKRGEVWLFLAEHYCAKMPPPIDTSKFPKYNIPYDELLKELTSQQHAILIDLGRKISRMLFLISYYSGVLFRFGFLFQGGHSRITVTL